MKINKQKTRPSTHEADLEHNSHLFKQVLDAAGVAMSIRDTDLRPIFANQAFTDFYGYSVDELRILPLEDILLEHTYTLNRQTILPTVTGGDSWEGEYPIRTKGGRLCAAWSRFDPVFDDSGNVTHSINFMRDASVTMRLRNALNQTERHLHFLAENTSDCLFRIRLIDGRYDYISSAVENITGYAPQEFYETPRLFERLSPKDWNETFETWWGEFLTGKTRYEYESPLIHKDGSEKWVNQRITVVKDDDGKPVAVEGILTDVTEQRKAQDDLATAQNSLNFISNSTSDIFFRLAIPEGTYDYLSPSVERFSGYTLKEYEDNPLLFQQIIHPDWRDYFQETWEELNNGIVRPEYVFQYLHKSGDTRWARQRVVLHKDSEGRPIAIEGIATDDTERMRAEDALKASEEKHRFLNENITDVVWTMDEDFNFTYATPSIEGVWGYTADELSTIELTSLFAPKAIRTLMEARDEWDHSNRLEMELYRKDGVHIWVETVIRRLFSQDGTPDGYQGISRDITERKLAEDARRASEEKYRFLAENITDVVWTLDNDYRFTYATPSVQALWGYSVNEFLAIDFHTLFTSESLKKIDDAVTLRSQAETAGKLDHVNRLELEHVHKDGSTYWAETMVLRLLSPQGEPVGYLGVTRDITERKKAEAAVQESEQKYRLLTETIEDVIWTMDEDLNYTYVSPSIEQLVGFTPAEYLTMPLADTMTPQSMETVRDVRRLRQEADAKGCTDLVNRFEIERIRKDGSTIWVESITRRLYGDGDSPAGYLGISRDISPRKHSELAVQESEARYRTLFEDSPISLWEEDLTRLKTYFDELKAQGVTDFRQHFYDNPEDLAKCATLVDVVGVNKATLDLLRAKSQEELIGNLDKVLTESSMAAFTEEMILLASGGCEYCGEITHRTLDGDIIWVVVHFLVPPEYQETLSRVIVSLLDVTPRKRAEQALMDSEERYRVLVENAQEGVVVTQDGVTKYINEGMTSILGYSTDELKQIHPLEMAHPDDKAMALDQLVSFVSGQKKDGFVSFRVSTKCAEVKWLTLNVKPIMWEGKEAQLEILTDITVHKALEDELRASHAEIENRVRKRTAELSEANIRLQAEAQEREKAQEHILSLTQQLIRIQEDERQRIARDLHDNVAQDLSSIVLRMETLFDGHPSTDGEILKRGEAVTDILRGAIASVRDIAYGLRPPALDQFGLMQTLENHCQDVGNRTGLAVDFYAAGIENINLDFDTEINMYRMVQEAIANVVKHAEASKVTVRVVKSHPDVLIRVEDNGQGFEVDNRMAQAVQEKRMGLKSMEERARLIGGAMEIQSLTGTGTRIVFKVPIESGGRQ